MLESIMRPYLGAYMPASIPSYGVRSIVKGMLRSVLEIVLGGKPGNIFGVYLDAS
jgi:hypothetical protein